MTSHARDSARDEQQTGIAVIRLGREYGSANFHSLVELEGRLLGEQVVNEIEVFP